MRKIINLFSTFAFVTAFAFVAVATVNVEFSQLSNLQIVPTTAFADDGGGGGDGGGGDGGGGYYDPGYYTCTNGATNYPYCTVCPSGYTMVSGVCTPPAPTADINSNPKSIVSGQSSVITWSSTNATYCLLNGGQFSNLRVGVFGIRIVKPVTNTTYSITCYNSLGVSANDTDYVSVTPATCTNGATNYPTCNNLCVVQAPQTQTLACPAGQTGSITQTRTSYCPSTTGSLVWNAWTTTSNTCANIVLPTGTISANPSVITVGQTSTLSWSSTNADYCVLGSGERVATSGTRVVSPSSTTSYSVTCYNTYGSSTTSYTTVTVNPIQQCTNGATNYPYCNNLCVVQAPQTQTLACPAGQTGSITQTRTSYCPSTTGSLVWNEWTTTSNTCQTVVVNPTANIYANPNTIVSGNSTTLTWSSTNATYCRLNGGQFNNYTVGTSGSIVVSPTSATTYTVTCYNANGMSATDTTYVNVTNAVCTNGTTNYPYCNVCPAGQVLINNACTTQVVNPTANIYANPSVINAGGSSTLTWSSANASYCVLNGGQFNNYRTNTSGSIVVSPTAYTSYSVTCYNANGAQATDTTYVSVNQAQTLPTVTIYPSSYSITQGGQVTLNWSSTNASYCTATPWPYSGSKAVSGSEVVTLNNTTTFTITCFNAAGQSVQAQTTVTVNPVNYTYCNGVQYPAGTVCPNTNTVGVSTTGANPLQTTANIFGYVNPNGTNATMWFEYGTNPNYLGNRTTAQNAYSAGPFSANLSGLSCGTTYYYRAVAQNESGVRYGNTLSFVTSACQTGYTVNGTTVTRPATAVGQNYGQLNGAYVYGNGTNTNSCSAYFQYGTNYNLVNTTNPQSLYNNYAVNNFSQALYGLSLNTTYYYRAVTNCGGYVQYGNVMSFHTAGYTVKPVYVKKPVTTVVKSPVICSCNNVSAGDTNSSNGGVVANDIYMDLVVERLEAGAPVGGQATYRVTYKNVASTTLTDVALRVILPSELSMVSADKGSFTAGGSSLTFGVSQLAPLEEGRVTIVTRVADSATLNNQISVNAYANYSVPTIVKNGAVFKDEVTAYVLSVVTNGTTGNNGNVTTTSADSIFGQNTLEWIILLALILGFIAAMMYLFSASKRRNNNN
jgi:hypothetical protein